MQMNIFFAVYWTGIKTKPAPSPPVDRLSHLFFAALTMNVCVWQQQVTTVVGTSPFLAWYCERRLAVHSAVLDRALWTDWALYRTGGWRVAARSECRCNCQ